MTVQNKRNRQFFRSVVTTMFIILCVVVALCLMGCAYSATERTAYGNSVSALTLADEEHISIFGKEVYLPIFKVADALEKVKFFASTGINKLLALTVDGAKELVELFIRQI